MKHARIFGADFIIFFAIFPQILHIFFPLFLWGTIRSIRHTTLK